VAVVVTEAAQEGAAATGGAAGEQERAAAVGVAVAGPAARGEAAGAAMAAGAAVVGAAGDLSLVGAEVRVRRPAPDSCSVTAGRLPARRPSDSRSTRAWLLLKQLHCSRAYTVVGQSQGGGSSAAMCPGGPSH
jgi:hypothetical protein